MSCRRIRDISNDLSESLSSVDEDDESQQVVQQKDDLETAGQGLSKISQLVNKFLGVLCTIYTTPPEWVLKTGESKGSSVLEGSIKALMGIADSKAVTGYFFQFVKNILQIQTTVKEQQQAIDGMGEEEKAEAISEIAVMGSKVYAMFLPEVKSLMEATAEEVEQFQVPSDKKDVQGSQPCHGHVPAAQTPFKDLMPKLIDLEVISRTTSGVKRARMGLIQSVVEAAAL
ncbi:UNVERIFIED_CONTAM: hypothetical protein HDU68_009115 [Siphonaria sp. JEL0065]|nr:hypothetical protein HDU68_009115 [Siphonaria sp. JEL0065]